MKLNQKNDFVTTPRGRCPFEIIDQLKSLDYADFTSKLMYCPQNIRSAKKHEFIGIGLYRF